MREYFKHILFRNKRHFVIALSLVVIVAYIQSVLTYFQSDEWYFFAKNFSYLYNSSNIFKFLWVSLTDPSTFNLHFTPVVQIIAYIQMHLFGLNFTLYQLMSILLHILVTLSIFFLAFLMSKKNMFFAVLAGLFFALNYSHFQAVAWVAASSTQFALLFSLLSLIFLWQYAFHKRKIYQFIGILFFILAIFTKETSLYLFIVYPLVSYIKNGKRLKYTLYKMKFIGIFAIVYLVIRVVYLWFLNFQAQLGSEKVTYQLLSKIPNLELLYTSFTLVLKSMVQVFFPSTFIYFMGERITVWGFPQYAQEAYIRGFNFLTFAQSAGMELFIYPTGILMLFGLYHVYIFFRKNNSAISDAMIIGFAIILSAAVPFLLIANSLINVFGYLTLLDSRHMYTISSGAAFLFAAVFTFFIKRTKRKRVRYIIFFIILCWGLLQIYLINQVLYGYVLTANDRKLIIQRIAQTIPTLKKKTIIFVKSDTPYYGFGPIPPFQTNLGHVLSNLYYSKRQLPIFFLSSDYLIKKGIDGQGYKENQGRGFGYYIDEKNLYVDLEKKKFSTNDIFAFAWKGKTDTITDITKQIRQKAEKQNEKLSEFKEWDKFKDLEGKLTFFYPKYMSATDNTVKEGNDVVMKSVIVASDSLYIKIVIRKKPKTMGFGELITFLKDSGEQDIGGNYIFRNVQFIDGETVTTSYPIKGQYPKYFFPNVSNDLFFEISIIGNGYERVPLPNRREKYYQDVEKIISTIQYETQKEE